MNLATAFSQDTKAELRSAITSCVNGQCMCAFRRFVGEIYFLFIIFSFFSFFFFFTYLLCSQNDCIDCACAGPETDSTSIDDTISMSKKASDIWSLLNVSIRRSRKVRGGNYVQLATADNKGHPACRTVVFRGFLDVGTAKSGADMAMVCGWLYLLYKVLRTSRRTCLDECAAGSSCPSSPFTHSHIPEQTENDH